MQPVKLEPARLTAVAGIAGVAAGASLVGLLHLIPPSANLNPVRRTISEYALLETGWVFDLAVLALAAGSLAALAAMVWTRLATVTSAGSLALILWSVSLTAVVAFPKHNWSLGPSGNGTIHRVASVVAFLSLPVAAILIARAWRAHPRWRGHAAWTLRLGLLSLLCFAPILLAVVLEPVTGVRWWRAIPLGAVERLLATAEVITVLAMGWWAARAAREGVAGARGPVLEPVSAGRGQPGEEGVH